MDKAEIFSLDKSRPGWGGSRVGRGIRRTLRNQRKSSPTGRRLVTFSSEARSCSAILYEGREGKGWLQRGLHGPGLQNPGPRHDAARPALWHASRAAAVSHLPAPAAAAASPPSRPGSVRLVINAPQRRGLAREDPVGERPAALPPRRATPASGPRLSPHCTVKPSIGQLGTSSQLTPLPH